MENINITKLDFLIFIAYSAPTVFYLRGNDFWVATLVLMKPSSLLSPDG